jgi:predicted Zn-ribbon and HTH transcriptional regulator
MSPETEGQFLQPSLAYKEMLEIIEERYSMSLPKPIFHQRFIGDTLSILYSPFYVDAKIYDAVLNRPVSPELPEDFDISALSGEASKWRLQFIPAQCPDCGWDLEGERDSLALNCRNCQTVWQAGKGKFMKLKFAHVPADGGQITYLPFWRIKADISGLTLCSYADLVKTANLPKVVQEHWKDQAFHFWCPAFKVRPQDFLRFSRNVSLSQPQVEWVHDEMPDGELYPVTLPIMEAVESLKINLASFIKPIRNFYPRLQEIDIKAKSFILVYIPFHVRGNELSYPGFQLRINKNILRFARHL